MRPTAWQDAGVAVKILDERRRNIPYATDQIAVMLQVVRHFRPDARAVVDLGCGDGILARALLAEYPEASALLLDHSPPMLERARAAMAGYDGRCRLALADLAAPLSDAAAPGSVDVVVSGFAIHHLPDPRKRELYAEVHELLAPGGVFLNIEHVASATSLVEALFDRLYIDNLAARSGKPRAQVKHEHHTRPDKADNILAPLNTQLRWLRDLGYDHADCYFRWFELAVFGAVKRGGSTVP